MPTEQPEAELWFGAHPADPATLDDGRPLTALISAEPGVLGEDLVKRYGRRLPFMLKVLAAEQPLSLQAHPDAEQAEQGYARENREEVPLDAPERSYVDTHHKPELVCALSEFEALCGFRDPRTSADALGGLDVPELASIVALLRQDDPGQALREAVTTLLTLPREHRTELVGKAVAAAGRAEEHPVHGREYTMLVELGKRYPSDSGVLVALLLNHVFLRPGEALFMPAGNMHAYLRGVGVEVMAASDNVLRGGLTGKHVDVPELLRVLRFEVLSDPRVADVPTGPGVSEWRVPVEEFRLSRLLLDAGAAQQWLDAAGPAVVLCWSGQLRLDDGERPITLRPGQAAFVRADSPKVFVSGFGEGYCAQVPRDTASVT